MQNINKLGVFYLGKAFNPSDEKKEEPPILYDSKDLTTHAVVIGMTGSGKTGLGIALLEEAGIDGIPALIIDPKGDLGNLLLTFPDLTPQEFLPWIDESEAAKSGETVQAYSEKTAKTWKEGLEKWGEDGSRIRKYKEGVESVIYTPASQAGLSLSILNSFAAPPDEVIKDADTFRDRVMSTTSGLLGLLGIDADPIKSREFILLSTILTNAWQEKKNLDLPQIIQAIQRPPFNKVGVFDIDTFYPPKERLALSMNLNNLLASPGFQAWLEGEPLDIQRLLYTKEGKPRHAILSIAHLSDSERMFFVTLLLNELISWMRRQTGTSSLRALLYMDEVFGFFPPTAMPPSKMPMLTLLKQARAFGLGVVLSTQNPVDLDYKGLSNCGTWFIGKLQAARDKARVLEGLSQISKLDEGGTSLDNMLDSCGKRVFILRSVHLNAPLLLQTRWTLSYLKGPLTLPQIQSLTKKEKTRAPEVTLPSVEEETTALKEKPLLPNGTLEFYLIKDKPTPGIFTPLIIGIAKLHFVDVKNKIDTWQKRIFIAPLNDEGKDVLWDQAEQVSDEKANEMSKTAPDKGSFEELPSSLMQAKNYSNFQKSFSNFLYQSQTLDLFQNSELNATSKEGESEGDFKTRLSLILREKRDEGIKKIRDRYQSKIDALEEKIKRAQEKVDRDKTTIGQKKFETYVSIGSTLLGTLFGGKKGVSKGTITAAGSSLKKIGKVTEDSATVQKKEESISSYNQELENLEEELQGQIAQLMKEIDPDQLKIDQASIRPRKTDITIETIGVIWVSK